MPLLPVPYHIQVSLQGIPVNLFLNFCVFHFSYKRRTSWPLEYQFQTLPHTTCRCAYSWAYASTSSQMMLCSYFPKLLTAFFPSAKPNKACFSAHLCLAARLVASVCSLGCSIALFSKYLATSSKASKPISDNPLLSILYCFLLLYLLKHGIHVLFCDLWLWQCLQQYYEKAK